MITEVYQVSYPKDKYTEEAISQLVDNRRKHLDEGRQLDLLDSTYTETTIEVVFGFYMESYEIDLELYELMDSNDYPEKKLDPEKYYEFED